MTKFYLAQYYWLPLAPVVIAVCGIVLAIFLSRRRWLVHIGSVALMLMAPAISIYLREAADPTLIEGPGPGDGLILVAYILVMVLCLFVYTLAAWMIPITRPAN